MKKVAISAIQERNNPDMKICVHLRTVDYSQRCPLPNQCSIKSVVSNCTNLTHHFTINRFIISIIIKLYILKNNPQKSLPYNLIENRGG